MKLPLRERVLNAYAGGFAPRWIAERFGVSLAAVRAAIHRGRAAGDYRAVPADPVLALRRRNMTVALRERQNSFYGHLLPPDEFNDLPGVYEPILPFGGRIPQSVEDLEWR